MNVGTTCRKIPKVMEQQATQNKSKEKEEVSPNLVMSPGKMRVIKRNGKVVSFEDEKIKVAIMKAFLAVEEALLPVLLEFMKKSIKWHKI